MEERSSVGSRDPCDSSVEDQREFRSFLVTVWAHLGLPAPTPLQLDIARYLQRGPRRRVILAFRGVGKSWIYAAYLAWRLWRRPDAKMLVVSATQNAAEGVAQFSRQLIREMDVLAPLRPLSGQRDGASVFDVGPARASKDASVRAVGIGGQITGARADEILADDVETLNNSATAAARARLSEQVREFDAVLRPGGRITFLGTPQGPDSLYSELAERGFRRRIWPAEVPGDLQAYDGALAPFVSVAIGNGAGPGDPLEPRRFGPEELEIRRMSYGVSGYARQFLLDARPADPDRFPLSLSNLVVMQLDDDAGPSDIVLEGQEGAQEGAQVGAQQTSRRLDFLRDLPMRGFANASYRGAWASGPLAPYTDALLAIDPSGRGEDETAYVALKALDGRLFLLDAGGCSGGYDDETLDRLVATAMRRQVRRIIVESNFGGGMFGRLLGAALHKAGGRAEILDKPSSGAKEERILSTLEPVFAQRRLVVDADVIRRDAADTEAAPFRSLFYQMARLRAERGALAADDRIDALALGVSALANELSVDQSGAQERRRRAAEQAAAQALEKSMTGRPRRRLWRLGPA